MGSLRTSVVALLAAATILTGAFLVPALAPFRGAGFRRLGSPLSDYTRALQSEDEELREAALAALRKLGPEHATAVVAIAEELDSLGKEPRIEVIRLLGRMGAAALPALKAEVFHPDPDTSIAALEALGQVGGDGVPVVVQALCDDRNPVRQVAARVLSKLGGEALPAVPTLLSILKLEKQERKTGDTPYSRLTSDTLVAIGESALPFVLNALRDRRASPELRLELLSVLERMGTKARGAIPDLLLMAEENLRDLETRKDGPTEESQELIQIQAVFRALGALGPEAARELVRFLEAKIPRVREAGLKELSSTEAVPEAALGPLLDTLQHRDEGMRLLAAQTLGRMGEAAAPAVDILFQRLLETDAGGDMLEAWSENLEAWPPDNSRLLRRAPAPSRRRTSSRARRTRPSTRTRSPRASEAEVCFQSIVRIGEGAALELGSHASSADKKRRYLALALLDSMGAAAGPARPALLSLLKDDDLVVRARAVSALGRCRLQPRETAELLFRLYRREVEQAPPQDALKLEGRLHSFGMITARALAILGAEAAPVIVSAMKDDDWRLRLLAVSALQATVTDPPPPELVRAVPALIRLLEDERNVVRPEGPHGESSTGEDVQVTPVAAADELPPKCIWLRAIDLLAALGPEARDAVGVLVKHLDDEEVRGAVIRTLGCLGPAAAESTAPLFRCLVREAKASMSSSETSREYAIPLDVIQTLVLLEDAALPALSEALQGEDADARYWTLRALAAVATGNRLQAAPVRTESRPLEPSRRSARPTSRAGPSRRPTRSPRTAPSTALRSRAGVRRGAPIRPSVRRGPSRAASSAAPPKRHSIAALLADLLAASRDPDAGNRSLCLRILGEADLWLEEASPEMIAAVRARLLAVLREPEGAPRSEAARALGAMGPEAAEATPSLARLLAAEVERLEKYCDLEAARGPRAIFWRNRDRDQDPRETTFFWALMESLRELGTKGISIPLRQLQELRGENDENIAWCALHLIEQVLPEPEEALAVVVECLEDRSVRVRQKAVKVLAAYGPRAADALGALVAQVERESRRLVPGADEESQLGALMLVNTFFQAIEKAEGAAVPHLKVLLHNSAAAVRRRAIRSLMEVKAPARDALEALSSMPRDSEPAIREYRAWAVNRLKNIEKRGRLAMRPAEDKPGRSPP